MFSDAQAVKIENVVVVRVVCSGGLRCSACDGVNVSRYPRSLRDARSLGSPFAAGVVEAY